MTKAAKLTAHDTRRVAVVACCDPRSVVARLDGRKQHSTVAARIDAALIQLGFELPSRAAQPSGPQSEPPRAA